MILCDTNVIIALVDDTDELCPTAREELKQFGHRNLAVTEPVLTETVHFLSGAYHRRRLYDYLSSVPITLVPPLSGEELYREMFAWLERYAEHTPGWADAHLAVLCGNDRSLRVWTYDREFQTIWRRPDGTKIPLVGKRRPHGF